MSNIPKMKWLRLWPLGLVELGTVVVLAAQQPVAIVSPLPVAATLADGTSNPTTTSIASFNMCFNGTTWDRECQGAASGGNGIDRQRHGTGERFSSDSTGQVKTTNFLTTVTLNSGALRCQHPPGRE